MPRFYLLEALMGGDIVLTESVYNEIVAHAREGKPQEVCGVLRGRRGKAFGLVRGRNVASNPVMDYEIDAQTLLRQFDFEDEGDEMVGVYHSHPVSPAYPSGSDAWNAHYPDLAYLICSLEDDERPILRAFYLAGQEVSLDPSELRAALDFDETRPGRFAFYQAADQPLPRILQDACAAVPTPFYLILESLGNTGKDFESRLVSVTQCPIQIVPS
jgi:proteasome lid subunit RPN8/RPN11